MAPLSGVPRGGDIGTDYVAYAAKMRGMLAADCDLEADVRFVDMMLPRLSVILDLGSGILKPGGQFVVGTSTHSRGGPEQQESAVRDSALKLTNLFSNWHLGPFSAASPWSVSVYSDGGARPDPGGPDGIFVLRS